LTKPEIRAFIREAGRKISPALLRVQSEEVLSRLETLPHFKYADTVLLYWSLPDEVFTHDFIRKWAAEKTILLPVICGDELHIGRCADDPFSMDQGMFGVRQPSAEDILLEDIDIAVIPGVAFDRSMNRLGRGKGYYDRFLEDKKFFKAGLCYDHQFLDIIPADPHDIKMDVVIH